MDYEGDTPLLCLLSSFSRGAEGRWPGPSCVTFLLSVGIILTAGGGAELLPAALSSVSLAPGLGPTCSYPFAATICLTFWRQRTADNLRYTVQISAREQWLLRGPGKVETGGAGEGLFYPTPHLFGWMRLAAFCLPSCCFQ